MTLDKEIFLKYNANGEFFYEIYIKRRKIMRNTTRKILLALTVVLALVCVFAVAAFATEYKIPVRDGWEAAGGPMGVIHDDTANGWKDSGYSDIDDHVSFTNGEKDVWVMIATNGTADLKSDKYPNLTYGNSFYAYFNEYERKVVIVAQGNLHSQLSAYSLQDSPTALLTTAKNYALYDKLYNLFAMEYIFTQDAFKDAVVPGLEMTWATYMADTIRSADIYSTSFPSSVSNANADTRTNEGIIVMERAIAKALYTLYSADETYAAAFAEANSPSTLTGSTYKPATDKQKMSRALLTGLALYAQELGASEETTSALSEAAMAYSETNTAKYYFVKGSGGSFGWKSGLENYLGDYGYVAMAFLINPSTSENANVGCLGNSVDTLELRNLGSKTRNFQNFGSVLTAFDKTTKVLIDTSLVTFAPESNASLDRGMFRLMNSLTTISHVTFAKDGTYTGEVKEGTANLSGFTANSKKEYGYTGYMLYGSAAVTDVVYYKNLMWASSGGSVDVSGVIYDYTLYGATNLKSFTIPANADTPLSQIRKYVFANSGLKEMYVLRAVSEDLTIASTAFSGCDSVTMYVLDKTSAANAVAALKTAGVKNVSVELFNPVQNPVSSTGVLVKMKDFTSASSDKLAIRFQFLWEEKGEAAAANAAAKYTFKGLGVIASTAATYESYEAAVLSETGLASSSLVAQEMLSASAGENSKVVNVLVTNADFTDGRRVFLSGYDAETGYYPFCLSLYGMTGDQITSEYYVAAYTEWEDADGNTFYTFTTLDYTKDGEAKNSISLYDTTLGLVKRGQINGSDYESEEDAQKYFYSVLELGALTTNKFTSHSVSANLAYAQFLNADGSFTYWNVDYRKYTSNPDFTGTGLSAILSAGSYGYRPDTTEAVATSGVQWSILRDGAKYIVLLTKNKNAAPEGVSYNYMVPSSGRNSQYGYYQPFHYLYGNVYHNKKDGAKDAEKTRAQNGAMTVYSPAVTESVYNAITTVVVDHGIVALATDSLAGIEIANTFVLPESCVTIMGCAIDKNTRLTDIIWTGDPDAKSEEKYNVDHLYDLRGCSTVNPTSFLCDNTSAVNVVTQKCVKVDGQLTFRNTAALERYWSADGYSGYTMPNSGVVDVSKGSVGTISKGYFDSMGKITTIKVPGAAKVGMPSDTDGNGRSHGAMGRTSYNYVVVGEDTNFSNSLKSFISYLHDPSSKNYKAAWANYADNLLVNGVSVKTLWPDLFS